MTEPRIDPAARERLTKLLLAGLLLGVVAAYGDLRKPGLSTGDEALVALRARGLVELGHWWTPYWNGAVDLHKPPLYLWLVGIGYRFFGEGELAIRLPSVLAFLALLFVVHRLATRLFDAWVGLVAAVVTAAHPFLFSQSRVGMQDTMLTLFSLLAITAISGAASPLALIGFGIACALAVLTKSLAATPVMLASMIYVLAFRPRLLSSPIFYAALAIAVVVPGIWFASQYFLHPRDLLVPYYVDFVRYRFRHDVWSSYFVYFRSLRWLWASWGGLAPFVFAAPLLMAAASDRELSPDRIGTIALLVLFALATLGLILSVRQQEPWYCLPIVGPLAIFAGKVLVDLVRGDSPPWVFTLASLLVAAGTFLSGAYLPVPPLIWGVRIAALAACVTALAAGPRATAATVAFLLAIALAVAGGLSLRNPQVNLHRPRNSDVYRDLAGALCDPREFPGPLIVDFRHFPQNSLMFYSRRDTIQVHRLRGHVPPGEQRCGLMEGEGYENSLAGFDVKLIRKIGAFSLLSIANAASTTPSA